MTAEIPAPDDADRSDAIIVTWQYPDRPSRRVVFEPVTGGWDRSEQEYRDGWREVGRERVDQVSVEVGRT